MIYAVYKGIMKAVTRSLILQVKSDREAVPQKRHSMDAYLAFAENVAYEEICRAFGINGKVMEFVDVDDLYHFVDSVARQIGLPLGSVKKRTYNNAYFELQYVSIKMPDAEWNIFLELGIAYIASLSPEQLKSSPLAGGLSGVISRLPDILPDLDRMSPILNRMTNNIVRNFEQEYKIFQIKEATRNQRNKKK